METVLRGLKQPLSLVLTSAYLQGLPAHSLDLAKASRAKMLHPGLGLGPVQVPEGPLASPCPCPRWDLPCPCLTLGGTASFQRAGMESCRVMPTRLA